MIENACINDKLEILTEHEIFLRREKFESNAKENYNLDTSENSAIRPILDFVFKQKIDIINEIRSISKNYDIRRSTGLFLDLEANKVGIERKLAKKTKIKCKIIASSATSINIGTSFTKEGGDSNLIFKAIEYREFKEDGNNLITLEAENAGSNYNIFSSSDKLNLAKGEPNISYLEYLEFSDKETEGTDNESDDEFRARILKTIKTFSKRDISEYYSGIIEEKCSEYVKEAYVARGTDTSPAKAGDVCKDINLMKIRVRLLKENADFEVVKGKIKDAISDTKPAGAGLDIEKAEEVAVNVKLKQFIGDEEAFKKAKSRIESYLNNLKMGGTYSIFLMYRLAGEGIDILSPIESKTIDKDKYFKATVSAS